MCRGTTQVYRVCSHTKSKTVTEVCQAGYNAANDRCRDPQGQLRYRVIWMEKSSLCASCFRTEMDTIKASHNKIIGSLKSQMHHTNDKRDTERVIHESHLARARSDSQTGKEYIRHANEISSLDSEYYRLGEKLEKAQAKKKQDLARFYEAMAP